MRRQSRYQSTIRPVFLLTATCLVLWSQSLQTPRVSAYQGVDATSTPSLESTVTPPPQAAQPAYTHTAEATLTSEFTETATNLSSATPIVPASSSTPTLVDTPLPILPGEYVPDEVLVGFKKAANYESVLQCISSMDATVLSSIEQLNVLVVQGPYDRVEESIAEISVCPKVRYVEPNYIASIADTIPSDPGWSLQYGLVNIRAPQGWDYSTGSTAVTIAIVDSGVDLAHADLSEKIVPGFDFVNGDSTPQDDNGHGTHVAGIAAASGNNGIGVTGVSWGARIMPIKVLDSSGIGNFVDLANGIIWAADHGAQVINLSLGGSSPSTVLQDAVNYAYGKGVLLVAAAGNTGGNFVLYPARYPNVIAVGAVDSINNHAGFSNFGPELDLVAPGSSIYSTLIDGFGYQSGTSMAAAYVSGLAAILFGIPGNSYPDLIASEMKSSALDLGLAGFDDFYGFGLIQMDAAIGPITHAMPPDSSSTKASISHQPIPANTLQLFPYGYSSPAVSPFGPLNKTATNTNTLPTSSTNTSTLIVSTVQLTVSSTLEAPFHQEKDVQAQSLSSWQLPCAGLAFLLAGLLLLWAARREQDKPIKLKIK